MGDWKQRRKQLLKWWQKSPKCRKCGTVTVIKPADALQPTENTATYQHKYPKGHPKRSTGKNTLWCWTCNSRDGQEWGDWLVIERVGTIVDIQLLQQMLDQEEKTYYHMTADPEKIQEYRILGILARATAIVNQMDTLLVQSPESTTA